MKGIILAGGSGTRLYPVTKIICKQLLPIYDKPLIYYPLSILMLANIRDILIISTPNDIDKFKQLFGDGSSFGINLSYAIQDSPNGIAEAFIIGEKFIGSDSVALVLGDNILYGNNIENILSEINMNDCGALVFGYSVDKPERFGVLEFDKNKNVISIEEKPDNPKSNFAVIGLYFYDNDVVKIAKSIAPSARGELEITEVNNQYIKQNKLKVKLLGRGVAWFDTGTSDSMTEASSFVKTLNNIQAFKLACIEEIAYRKKWIDKKDILKLIDEYGKSKYAEYLKKIYEETLWN